MTAEPTIAVGLVQNVESVTVRLEGDFVDASGAVVEAGEHRFTAAAAELALTPEAADSRFSLEATIGIDFHWEQTELQSFRGRLRLVPSGADRLTVVNDVPLETYVTSVICSEMRDTSPAALAKAHAVVSRSWLLAQVQGKGSGPAPPPATGGDEIIRWYDREVHALFDVCADDHCQRYQGVGRVRAPRVAEAIGATRGQVLVHDGQPCDARFSKCCGGVTEDFSTAWSDTPVPYLVPFADAPDAALPQPPLTDEAAVRAFIEQPPAAWCNCSDEGILREVLNEYDQETRDFFRWQTRLEAETAARLVRDKLGIDLGRILAIEPLTRGLSGRLIRLRLTGERGAVVIGKELEIRRALSASHLYSSAFVVDPEGDPARPEAFLLRGAGWGHGVGMCQIGAAAMASAGEDYAAILAHYYPGTGLERLYS